VKECLAILEMIKKIQFYFIINFLYLSFLFLFVLYRILTLNIYHILNTEVRIKYEYLYTLLQSYFETRNLLLYKLIGK
jgi:hypothetical protein